MASWVVLGGPSPADVGRLGQAPRFGFETAITVPADPADPAYLAVEAVTNAGQVFARSQAQRSASVAPAH